MMDQIPIKEVLHLIEPSLELHPVRVTYEMLCASRYHLYYLKNVKSVRNPQNSLGNTNLKYS